MYRYQCTGEGAVFCFIKYKFNVRLLKLKHPGYSEGTTSGEGRRCWLHAVFGGFSRVGVERVLFPADFLFRV